MCDATQHQQRIKIYLEPYKHMDRHCDFYKLYGFLTVHGDILASCLRGFDLQRFIEYQEQGQREITSLRNNTSI